MEQGCRLLIAGLFEAAGSCPPASGRIVKFRAGETDDFVGMVKGFATGDQHFAVWQQGRCVIPAGGVQTTGDRPSACDRIIEFRAGEGNWPLDRIIVQAASSQHLPVGEQRGCEAFTGGVQAPGILPLIGSRTVEFRASYGSDFAGEVDNVTTSDQRL